MLLNKKSIAKVSKIPGKTKLINYFLVNNDKVNIEENMITRLLLPLQNLQNNLLILKVKLLDFS